MTRYVIIPDSMVFLGLGFIEKAKKKKLVGSVTAQVGENFLWWRELLYWAVVTIKLPFRAVVGGKKIKAWTCPQPLSWDNSVLSAAAQWKGSGWLFELYCRFSDREHSFAGSFQTSGCLTRKNKRYSDDYPGIIRANGPVPHWCAAGGACLCPSRESVCPDERKFWGAAEN